MNPADTTYTITTAWHVGRALIDGYDHGGVPAARVVEAVGSVLNSPQTPNGRCAAYSKHPNDSRYPCIWNVGAAAAWFLWRAHQRGLYPAGRGDETLNKLDDPGHLGATVSAMYEADPSIGVPALSPEKNMRLAVYSATVQRVADRCNM